MLKWLNNTFRPVHIEGQGESQLTRDKRSAFMALEAPTPSIGAMAAETERANHARAQDERPK
jgi:hypothetical protein